MNTVMRRTCLAALPVALALLAPLRGPGQMLPLLGEGDELPSASVVLERVRDAFPPDPVVVLARIEPRGDPGRDAKDIRARIRLDWGATPPAVNITLADVRGSPLADLDVVYPDGRASFHFRYPQADPPSADAPIFGTDFTWADLALSFLWWPGGEFRGFENRRGRRCYVVDIPAPSPSEHASSVRLWVDAHVYALLQADVRDAHGTPTRRLAVRSLRRVGLQWTLEDLEMRDLREGTRTLLRVDDMFSPDAIQGEPDAP